MLAYNEVKPRKYIVFNGQPHEVLDSHVFRKQQRKPVNAVKLKNLLTSKVVENSFAASDKVEEAEIMVKQVKYIYSRNGEHWFCDAKNASQRFKLTEDLVGNSTAYIKANDIIDLLDFKDTPIGLKLPIKVDLKVTEAPPDVRGNTAQGGVKQVVLETGLSINTPMFINEGDIIKINTDTGEYVERVEKS